MKKRFFSFNILFMIFLLSSTLFFSNNSYIDVFRRYHQPVVVNSEPSVQIIREPINYEKVNSELYQKFEIFDGFVGFEMRELESNKTVSQFNSEKYFIPASLTKLITAYAVLETFNQYDRIKTSIYNDSPIQNFYTGNLYIKGYGNPVMTIEDYKKFLLEGLKEKNISRIYGNIYLDFSFFEDENFGIGWMWDDPQPQISAITIWQNNHDIFRYKTQNEIKDYIAFLTASYLKEFDIQLYGRILFSETPSNLNTLHSHNSMTIEDIIKVMLKKSDNQISEHMFRLVSSKDFEKANSENSIKKIESLINDTLFISNNEYILKDGTGLSMYNMFKPSFFNDLHRKMYSYYSNNYFDYLANPYEESTVKNRFDYDLWVKTGTLVSQSSISGIMKTKKGNYYIITLIENNYILRNSGVKIFENEIINFIYENY